MAGQPAGVYAEDFSSEAEVESYAEDFSAEEETENPTEDADVSLESKMEKKVEIRITL